ncbi:MAG: ribonuclease H-like domain-containing protein, partial [Candidatus Helarchaeota archaeon]
FDLLHFSRRAWKDMLPNCKLSTLETCLLGLEREIDLPSALVPEFYETYSKEQNPGPLVPIVEHNKQDLISLVCIFSKLREWSRS